MEAAIFDLIPLEISIVKYRISMQISRLFAMLWIFFYFFAYCKSLVPVTDEQKHIIKNRKRNVKGGKHKTGGVKI